MGGHGMTAAAAAETRYTGTAITLHWLLAALITVNFALGVYMHELPISPARLRWFNWHKWGGITILTLSALRLVWRLRHPPPPEVPMPRWQRAAARSVHRAFYALFFAVPLAGWAHSSASGFPVVLFGVLPLPDWVPVDERWAEVLKTTHQVLATALGVLVLLHAAAALKHHFVDRDGLLRRMGPRLGRAER